jgi:hypothetical protein
VGHIPSCLFVCLETFCFILGKLGRHTDIKSGGQVEVTSYMVLFDKIVYFFKDKAFVGNNLQSLFGAMDFRVGIEPTKSI